VTLRNILLFPISLLYGFIIWLRNLAFDHNILKEETFEGVFVIGVGNLSLGGTGKTTLIEWLINELSPKYKIAVLSRGYKRKTKGYIVVKTTDLHDKVGDEPLQIKYKYPDIPVVLHEKRVLGIQKIKKDFPETQVILMDDSFQHRYVKPDLNLLLTDYFNLYTDDFLFPAGTLREHKSNAKRADIVIVTKCERILSPLIYRNIKNKLNLNSDQILLTSFLKYNQLKPIYKDYPQKYDPDSVHVTAVCFSGIANSYWFLLKLKKFFSDVDFVEFGDHHSYTIKEINKIVKLHKDNYARNKVIVTTEKDAMRLQAPEFKKILKDYPVFYLPIECDFHQNNRNKLLSEIDKKIKQKGIISLNQNREL
jgi:tetraacyldisaccharide 4'-kinase